MTQGFTHKLLVVNFGGIGDEILFLPTLNSIRNHYPNWHITLLLEPRSKSVAQVTNLIDATIEFDIKKKPLFVSDLIDLLNLIRSGGYNTVISSGSSPLVSMLLFLSSIDQRIGYKSGWLSELLLTKAVPLNKQQYAANMYHDLVLGLEIKSHPTLPQIQAKSETIKRMATALFSEATVGSTVQNHRKKVLIHPGTSKLAISKGIIKTWSPACWVELISKLLEHNDIDVVLAGGPDDNEAIESLTNKLAGQRFISAFGLTKDLSDLAGLISLSDLLVCVDSAPMHLAVGLNKPLVALFGPTKPELLLPKATHFVALQADTTKVLSTNISGVQVEPKEVYQATMNLLQQNPLLISN